MMKHHGNLGAIEAESRTRWKQEMLSAYRINPDAAIRAMEGSYRAMKERGHYLPYELRQVKELIEEVKREGSNTMRNQPLHYSD